MRRVAVELAAANVAQQEPVAFEEVFLRHHDRLLRLAGLMCGDAAQAEDAVAEVFARLYPRWQPGRFRDLDAYLRRAVVNEVGGEFRRRARRRKPAAGQVAMATRLDGESDDHAAERDRVWRAMLLLPPRQRAVLTLRYFDDASEARIADILKLPVGTVKSTAARGLDQLRRLLGGDDDDD